MDNIRLVDCIHKSGLKHKYIAGQLSLSKQGWSNKINNRTEFRLSEIKRLCTLLNLDSKQRDHIFFEDWVDLKYTK